MIFIVWLSFIGLEELMVCFFTFFKKWIHLPALERLIESSLEMPPV
jgi:hypothetical protein